MLLRCLGSYNNYKLVNKPEPEAIVIQKQRVHAILQRLGDLLPKEDESPEDKKQDFFESQVATYFTEYFALGNEE